MITADQLRAIQGLRNLSQADAETAARALSTAEFGITTRLRLAAWLANTAQESGYRNVREDLYYRDAQRSADTFRTAFGGNAAAPLREEPGRPGERCLREPGRQWRR